MLPNAPSCGKFTCQLFAKSAPRISLKLRRYSVLPQSGCERKPAKSLSSTCPSLYAAQPALPNTISPTGLYHVVAPSRQVDTRQSIGFGALAIGSTSTLAPAGSVPGTATAISQNATMTQTLGAGYLSAYPSDEPRPLASNANVSGPNQDRASLSLTKVGGTGSIAYYSSGGTDLVVDITGYFD